MQKDKLTFKRIGLVLALTIISLSSLAAPSADAMARDPRILGRLQDQRNVLLIQERQLLEDYDDLQKQIRDVQQRNQDPKVVDQLCRQLDAKFSDLKQIQYDIKNVDSRLM